MHAGSGKPATVAVHEAMSVLQPCQPALLTVLNALKTKLSAHGRVSSSLWPMPRGSMQCHIVN